MQTAETVAVTRLLALIDVVTVAIPVADPPDDPAVTATGG